MNSTASAVMAWPVADGATIRRSSSHPSTGTAGLARGHSEMDRGTPRLGDGGTVPGPRPGGSDECVADGTAAVGCEVRGVLHLFVHELIHSDRRATRTPSGGPQDRVN